MPLQRGVLVGRPHPCLHNASILAPHDPREDTDVFVRKRRDCIILSQHLTSLSTCAAMPQYGCAYVIAISSPPR